MPSSLIRSQVLRPLSLWSEVMQLLWGPGRKNHGFTVKWRGLGTARNVIMLQLVRALRQGQSLSNLDRELLPLDQAPAIAIFDPSAQGTAIDLHPSL